VRREIAAALERDDVRVVPLLVSGAAMPRATELPEDLRRLATRQSFQLRYERFNADANDLIAQISKVVAPAGKRRLGRVMLTLGALAACLIAGTVIYYALPKLKPSNPVLLAQAIKLCNDASEATARLASTSDRAVWRTAHERFWELYNGPLYTIETAEKKHSPDGTSPLEAAMVRFGRQLKEVGDKPELPLSALAQGSLDVARACKDTVERM
jgi:hypothetical protein